MRFLLFVCLLSLSGLLACSNNNTGNNNNNNNTASKECESPGECWKKTCPQSDPIEYKECVQKRVNTQFQDGENHKPEYRTCTADNKCQDVSTNTLGGGRITVTLVPETTRIQWLRLMIFATTDMDGKTTTCDSLKQMATNKPATLMEEKYRRYWPSRDAEQPITTPILRQSKSLPMLFGSNSPTVPAGKHVVVIQGFCDPKAGSPTAETPFQWWHCQEGVAVEAGENNDIDVTLDTKQHPSCP